MPARTMPTDSAKARLMADFSLEMTAKDIEQIEEAAQFLPPDTRVSITFLPNEDFPGRILAAETVRAAGLVPVPHISARRLTSSRQLESFLDGLASRAAVEHVFVVAGDPTQAAGPYDDALAVIGSGLLGKYGIRRVGIAGYPEGHPAIANPTLWRALHDKHQMLTALGLDGEIMTQFTFDAEPVASWLDAVREAGINLPVRLGVAGPANVKTLLRFAARCGVGASAKVMSKYGLSITRLLGTTGPDLFLADLDARLNATAHGQIKLHLYPFGGLSQTSRWAYDYARA